MDPGCLSLCSAQLSHISQGPPWYTWPTVSYHAHHWLVVCETGRPWRYEKILERHSCLQTENHGKLIIKGKLSMCKFICRKFLPFPSNPNRILLSNSWKSFFTLLVHIYKDEIMTLPSTWPTNIFLRELFLCTPKILDKLLVKIYNFSYYHSGLTIVSCTLSERAPKWPRFTLSVLIQNEALSWDWLTINLVSMETK